MTPKKSPMKRIYLFPRRRRPKTISMEANPKKDSDPLRNARV